MLSSEQLEGLLLIQQGAVGTCAAHVLSIRTTKGARDGICELCVQVLLIFYLFFFFALAISLRL